MDVHGQHGHESDDPPGRDDATILPGGDADRTMPGPAGDDRTQAPAASPAPASVRGDRIPDRIGDCRVEKRLGSGGFGDVLLAVQESDLLRRRVAIKLLKRGMDSEAVLERFRVERKVLDTLNHPNIARLLGGGETEDGRSYLVMEFVDGLTLDLWCERQSLDLAARLRLLKQVAQALEHAHAKGIVHRDLKPANVLVGADGVPKLLDFGIAKIIAPGVAESERSHLTMPGETGPLTTAYASPEQLRGEPLSASTDIYSFGVMMYEVLTGQLPFDFSRSTFDDIRRRVCNETPSLPSAAAGGGARTTTDPKTTSGSMRRSLRGDVDNIVMMALRKEPTRRYASMTALIGDIDAHLEDRPVLARPSSLGYRLSKSLARNRWRVALAAALLLSALVAGVWYAMSVRKAQANYDAVMGRVKEFRNNAEFVQNAEDSIKVLAEAESLVDARLRSRPGDIDAEKDLVTVLAQQCRLYEATRDHASGLKASRRMVDVARAAHTRSPSDDTRQNLALALNKRGDLLLNSGDLKEARMAFEDLLALRREQVTQRPDDTLLMRLFGVALQRTRECALKGSDLEQAVRVDRELKEVRGKVMRAVATGSAATPSGAARQDGRTVEGKKANSGSDKPKEQQPDERDTAERQWMLSMLYLCSDLLALDRLQEAEAEGQSARDIAMSRLEHDRKKWRNHDDLGRVLEVMALIAYQRNDLPGCLALADQQVSRARAAVEASNATGVALSGFMSACIMQSKVRNDLGRSAEALAGLQEAVESAERFRSGKGDDKKGEAISAESMLELLAQRCRALRELGRRSEASGLVADIRSRLQVPRDGVQWHAACSQAAREASRSVEDRDAAVRLAQSSVESSLKSGDRLIESQAYAALHDALVAAGKPDAARALESAKAAAASSDAPRAKAMLAKLQPPAPPPPVAPQGSAPAAAPPAGGGKRP